MLSSLACTMPFVSAPVAHKAIESSVLCFSESIYTYGTLFCAFVLKLSDFVLHFPRCLLLMRFVDWDLSFVLPAVRLRRFSTVALFFRGP